MAARREMKVLSLGLPRTASASIADALSILGYENVFHALKNIENTEAWALLNRAADASFPVLPTYSREPFPRQQWDEIFGSCEAATDVASLFAPQLVRAYPNAKVILVVRDFEPWYKSFDEAVLQQVWNPISTLCLSFIEPLLGLWAGRATKKMLLGYFEARDLKEIRKNASMTYERHHRQLRDMVPADQLLVYRIGDGWGPICDFLGKPVPDVDFPRVNETAELKRTVAAITKSRLLNGSKYILSRALGAGLVGLVAWGIGRYYNWEIRHV